jgi:hypothetical protein
MNRRNSIRTCAIALLMVFLTTSAFAEDVKPAVTSAPSPDSLLFVGNSFTYFNNSLHMHVRELTKAIFKGRGDKKKAKRIYAKAMTISGAYLEHHVLGAKGMISEFRHERKKGPWDVVVVQGFSRGPIEEETAASFRHSARQLDAWIREAGGKTVLFMTWAYRDRPEMAAPLVEAYTTLGNELGALVVPVGLAFDLASKVDPKMNLYDPDKIHPSPLGTYLAANVFFAALYGVTPVGASYTAGLSPDQVEFAQRHAWNTVRQYFGDEPDP